MKRIPLKNYFILGIILASSIFIVLYINKLYLSTKNNDNILNGFIKEIKTQEIDNYIIENPNFIIYLGYKNNDSETNVTQNIITNNWVIYEDSGENYILLNTKTNEKITDVYDEGNERFISAQEAVDALNNKFNR